MLSRLLPRRPKSFTKFLGSLLSVPSRRFFNDRVNPNNIQVTLTDKPKDKSPYETLKFGQEFTDHMLEIDWSLEEGWKDPVIKPYSKFQIDPAATVFHYALEAFEGMKAYRDTNNNIRLFRPDQNWIRMNESCARLAFPSFNGDDLQKCLEKLLKIEKDWIPNQDGYSLYLRPTIIATDPKIGVHAASEAKLYIIMSPVGPYYPTGFAAVSLLASDKYVRAWPGGSGATKVGANYAPSILPAREAGKLGYSQILWIFPTLTENKEIRHRVEECGTMNMFVYWINKNGEKELVTSPLTGTILPGVTRDSVISLTKEYNEFNVNVREFYMDELIEASKENRIIEAFGAGTAAVISPIKKIDYKGENINIPLDPNNKNEQAGPLAKRIWNDIVDIQYGRKQHPWSVIVTE